MRGTSAIAEARGANRLYQQQQVPGCRVNRCTGEAHAAAEVAWRVIRTAEPAAVV
jgi:hypothetical protein